jgi:hypothetical protein
MLICSCVPGLLQMKLAADFRDTKDNSIGSCHHLRLSEKRYRKTWWFIIFPIGMTILGKEQTQINIMFFGWFW